MDCLVGYGSEDENESERHGSQQPSVAAGGAGGRRRDSDTNYDDVNMDMSEDSQAESEPELPPVVPTPPPQPPRDDRRSNGSRERDRERERDRDRGDRETDRREKRRDSPVRARSDRDRSDRRSPRRDDRYRSDRDRDRGRANEVPRRGLLGDRPDDRDKAPPLMEVKPHVSDVAPPPEKKSQDARDAVSPRFIDRERRDKERERERERDRDRHGRRSEEKRSSSHRHDRRDRSRSKSRGAPYSGGHSSSSERRTTPPSSDYRPTSYKVNKKLEVMEKMGLQIKTPDGSMATAQQLRAAACEAQPPGAHLPSYYIPTAVATTKIMDQKRKLLWSKKNKSEAEEAAKWSGTRFAQDSDGKQVSKFMRLMGIKEPAAVKQEPPEKAVDPIKKQEELFQAMQAQYEVARATTHTMRGVGLGFQRGQY